MSGPAIGNGTMGPAAIREGITPRRGELVFIGRRNDFWVEVGHGGPRLSVFTQVGGWTR